MSASNGTVHILEQRRNRYHDDLTLHIEQLRADGMDERADRLSELRTKVWVAHNKTMDDLADMA